jgi:hypothetical protein
MFSEIYLVKSDLVRMTIIVRPFSDVSQRSLRCRKEAAASLRRPLWAPRRHPEDGQRRLGREHLGAEAHGKTGSSKSFRNVQV